MFNKYNCNFLEKLGQQVSLSDNTNTTAIVELPVSSSNLGQSEISYREAALIISSSEADKFSREVFVLLNNKEYQASSLVSDGFGMTKVTLNENKIASHYQPYGY